MEKTKILVVDDQKVVAELFQLTLGPQGYTIRYASSASEALEALEDQKFDVAFLDLVMPGIDGLMLLKKIKHAVPAMPVVMMSGFSMDVERKEAEELGAVTTLKKPFEMDEVVAILRKVLKKDI